jgi:hypothetical protein
MTKIPAYYFLLIVASVFFGSGIGLITNSTRSGSEQVGFGFVAFGIITLTVLAKFQNKFLNEECRLVIIRIRIKSLMLKRTVVDALVFQYYFFSYAMVFAAYALLLYFKNGEPMNNQDWMVNFIVMPMGLVIVHNNVGRIMRWVLALVPLVLRIVFLCFFKFR